jgi:hypothetical protein
MQKEIESSLQQDGDSPVGEGIFLVMANHITFSSCY